MVCLLLGIESQAGSWRTTIAAFFAPGFVEDRLLAFEVGATEHRGAIRRAFATVAAGPDLSNLGNISGAAHALWLWCAALLGAESGVEQQVGLGTPQRRPPSAGQARITPGHQITRTGGAHQTPMRG